MPFALGDVAPNFLIGLSTNDYEVQHLGTFPFVTGSSITGNIDIGSAEATREIFAVACTHSGRDTTVISITVNSTGMTLETGYVGNISNDESIGVACGRLALASGSGSVAFQINYFGFPITFILDAAVSFFRVVKRPIGGGADDSSGAYNNGTSVTVNATTIDAQGFMLAGCVCDQPSALTPPAGLKEVYNAVTTYGAISIGYRDVQAVSSTPSDQWTGPTAEYRGASWSFS